MNQHPPNSSTRESASATATDARLPVSVVLEALADDLGDRQVQRAVAQLLPKLNSGKPIDEALAECEQTTPPYLVGLLRSATSGDQLAETCDCLVRLRDVRQQTWLALRGVVAYPLVLLLALTGLTFMVSWVLVPAFAELFTEFDLELPPITESLLVCAPYMPWLMVGLLLVLVIVTSGPRWFGVGFSVRNALPIVGRLTTSLSHQQFATTLASFVRLKFPLPDALRYTADLLDDRGLARATRRAAEFVVRGTPLSVAMHSSRSFDRALAVLTGWGEAQSNLASSLDLAAEMFTDRRQQRLQLLKRIVPPFALVAVAGTILSVAAALLIPLVKLIEGLS